MRTTCVLGTSPMAKSHLGSHPSDIGPGGEGVKVKHGFAPAVDGQCDAKDADDVHDYSCLRHISNLEVSIGEDNGIWGCGNRQHEGK